MKRWQPEEIKFLVLNFPHCSTQDIAYQLNRTYRSVAQKANGRGLQKTRKYMTSYLTRNNRNGQKSYFKPGNTAQSK